MNWIGAKQHPTQFASNKNTPGKSSSEIVERSADYFKRIAEEAKPTKEYDSASIEVLKGMEPPVQHGEAYVPEVVLDKVVRFDCDAHTVSEMLQGARINEPPTD